MEGYSASSYGDAIADIYDEMFIPDAYSIYGDGSETTETVDYLAKLSDTGPALEIGVGTGRVALALHGRGIAVTGIEVSAKMIERLRTKPGGPEIAVLQGDFLTIPATGRFPLVYTVFNTIMAFQTQEAQLSFFLRAREHLTDDGLLVVENAVPPAAHGKDASGMLLRHLAVDHVVTSAFAYDAVSQRVKTTHMLIHEHGTRFFPLVSRHIFPSEMDLMARLAGLRLRSRTGGWREEPFTAASKRHVSVYACDG